MKPGSVLACGGGESLSPPPWQAVSTIATAITIARVRTTGTGRCAGWTLKMDFTFFVSDIC
jgi:hypothetical protein